MTDEKALTSKNVSLFQRVTAAWHRGEISTDLCNDLHAALSGDAPTRHLPATCTHGHPLGEHCWYVGPAVETPTDPLEYKLPCEVRIPPSTSFGKGVTLRALMHALRAREGQPDEVTRFHDERAKAIRNALRFSETSLEKACQCDPGPAFGQVCNMCGGIKGFTQETSPRPPDLPYSVICGTCQGKASARDGTPRLWCERTDCPGSPAKASARVAIEGDFVPDHWWRVHRELANGHTTVARAVVAAAIGGKPLPECMACDVAKLAVNAQNGKGHV